MRCVNTNKCNVVSSNLQIWARSLEKLKIKLIERIVCQCWSFEGCFSLYVNKPLFYYLFFLINWLLNDCSSWNMNVFVLVVELIWFIPFQSVTISSYFVFFVLIVLFNTRKFKIIKVKTSCNLYYRFKEKRKFHETKNFARNLDKVLESTVLVPCAQCKSFSRTDSEYWMTGACSSFY